MKRSIIFSLSTVLLITLCIIFSGADFASAQSYCPSGYICTPNSSPIYNPPIYSIPPISTCTVFMRNIGIGTVLTSEEPNALAYILSREGISYISTGNAYTYFTASAIARLQEKYGISSIGIIGPITRARLNSLYPCGGLNNPPYYPYPPTPYPPTQAGPLQINTPDRDDTWTIGDRETIRWTSPYYIRATYVDIILVPQYTPCNGYFCPMNNSSLYPYRQSYTIVRDIHVNDNDYRWEVGEVEETNRDIPEGEYTIQICESDTNVCTSSAIFRIDSDDADSDNDIEVTSPDGDEDWEIGERHNITWSSEDNDEDEDVRITLSHRCPDGRYCTAIARPTYVIQNATEDDGSYSWNVGRATIDGHGYYIDLPEGDYVVNICQLYYPYSCDSSDDIFTISD